MFLPIFVLAKVSEIIITSKKILDDVKGYDNLNQSLKLLLTATQQQNSELFDSWTAELTAKIKSNKMSLKDSDNVVHLLDGGKMQVNYCPYFITLISEVRQLTAMGYNIPRNIFEISEHAKKFATHAKTLEQVGNTIHQHVGIRNSFLDISFSQYDWRSHDRVSKTDDVGQCLGVV